MAGERSGKKDWRGGGRVAAGASVASQEKAPDYMRRRDTTLEEIARDYRRKVAFWGTLFLGLLAWLIYVLIPWPVRPPLLIAAITQYNYPLPPNAWAEEDQELLMELDGQQRIVRCNREKDGKGEVADYNSQWTGLSEKAAFAKLEAKLREAELYPGGPNNNVVMLYISMHGAVRGDGEPCLIPPGPFAHDSSRWYSAKNLLDQLFGGGKAKKRVKYLVFFDCGRVDADWNLGWLYSGFPQRLGDKVKDLAIDNLNVVTSTSPGQISWTAPELKGSVFGRFLYRGLQGRADKFGGNSDQVVTLSELFRYLSINVSDWVKTHRDDEQTPMLFGKEGRIDVNNFPKKDDFALVAVPKHPTEESLATDAAETSRHWPEIAKAWVTHKQLRDSGAAGHNPLEWQEYQHHLLFVEQLALAGKAGESKISAQLAEIDQLADELRKRDAEPSWPGYSLPQVRPQIEKLNPQAIADAKPDDVAADSSDAASKQTESPPDTAAGKPADSQTGKQPEKQADKVAGASGTSASQPAAEKSGEKPGQGATEKVAGEAVGSAAGKSAADNHVAPSAGESPAKTARVEPPPKPPGPAPDYLTGAAGLWQHCTGPNADISLLEELPTLPRERKADLIEMHFLRMLKAYLGRASNNDLRLAIKSRKLAEEAAWPGDLRAQYAIYGIMQQADRHRRLAEDRLFVGGTFADNDSPRSHWDRANENEGYSAAKRTAEEAADAFRVRDEALAEIPAYAQWMLHRGQRDLKLEGQLHNLVEKANTFSASLDRTLQDYSDATSAIYAWPKDRITAKGEVVRLLSVLKAAFETECNYLDKQNEGSPKDEFRRLGVVLSIALESGQRRNRLRQRYNEILVATAKAVARENPETNAVYGQEAPASTNDQAAGVNLLARWPTHPALLILGEPWHAKPQGNPALDLASQGDQVREKLNGSLDELRVAAWCKKSRDALRDPKSVPLAVRSGYAEGDRESRSVAALWVGREMPAVDLSAELRRVDRRNLMLWLAQRTVDDFWGPKPGERTPYFQTVAEEYLLAANALTPPSPLAKIVQRLATEVISRGVVRPTVLNDIYLDADSSQGDSPQVQVKLDVMSDLMERGGEAAVYFEDQAQHAVAMKDRSDALETVLRHPLAGTEANSSEPMTLKTYLDLGRRAAETKSAWVRSLYRGHVRAAQIQVVPVKGQETVVMRPDRVPPAVLVKCNAPRKTSVVFIFDCSGSMSTEDVDVHLETMLEKLEKAGKHEEAEKLKQFARQAGRKRIDWAREQLNTILAELAKQPNQYRVGLLTYGSRYAYDSKILQDTKLMDDPQNIKKKYIRSRADSNSPLVIMTDADKLAEADPDTDYEKLLDLGDFDEEKRSQAESKLKELKATGQTPLYYTVIKAIKLLEEDKANRGQKRIVVITDGINEQTTLVDAADKKIKHDVTSALKEAKKSIDVRLDVIAFCIKPDPGQEEAQYRDALEDLKSLVKEQSPPGELIARDDPSSLLDALEKLVEMDKFVLSQGEEELPPQIDSEKKRDLPLPANGISVPYSVSVKEGASAKTKADFEVEGGEFVKLLFLDERETGGSPRLLFVKPSFEHDASLRDHALVNGLEGQSQYDVKVDLGEKTNGVVTFPITIQNHSDREFSHRPKSLWAEIVPILPNGEEKPRYTLYDMSFINGSEVPKLAIRVSGWPSEATKAKVLLWFKFTSTEPDEDLSLNDDRWKKDGDSQVFELHGRGEPPERTIRLKWKVEEKDGNPSCSVVVEQSVPSDMDLHTYKIELKPPRNSSDSGPDEIRCRSLPSPVSGQNGKVIHTFVFRIKPTDIWNYRICVTSQKKIRSNSLSPPRELEVHVD